MSFPLDELVLQPVQPEPLQMMPLQTSTQNAAHDQAAAAGLLALETRVNTVPTAVYEFLQAGGVVASITIIASKPVHPDLQAAAVSLLLAVVNKQPAAAYAAFRDANGMASMVQLLLLGARLSSGNPPSPDGAKLVAAASQLVCALLEVDVIVSGQAFCQAGGLLALRSCIMCAPVSEQGFVVADEAVSVLTSMTTGGPGLRVDAMIVFANAICAAHMARPLLLLVDAAPLTSAAVKALEVLRKLAASSNTNLRMLQQARCLEDMLALLRVAPLDSRVAKLAATLLRDFAEWDPSTRESIIRLGGISTLLAVLRRAPASDVLTCHLVAGTLGLLASSDVDSSALSGKSLLHWAAQFGDVGLVSELLQEGMLVNSRDGRGNTPLHLAALGGHLASIRELLLSRADALEKNADGNMAHHLAKSGTPARRMLKSELSWRLCLEEPQPCQLIPLGAAGGVEEQWQVGCRCHFRPLTGEVVIEPEVEETGVSQKKSSRDWLKRVVSDVAGLAPKGMGGRRRTPSASEEVEPLPTAKSDPAGPVTGGHHSFVIPMTTRLTEVDEKTLDVEFVARASDGTLMAPAPGVSVEKLSVRIVAPLDLTAADLAMGISFLRQRVHPEAFKEPEADSTGGNPDGKRGGGGVVTELHAAALGSQSDGPPAIFQMPEEDEAGLTGEDRASVTGEPGSVHAAEEAMPSTPSMATSQGSASATHEPEDGGHTGGTDEPLHLARDSSGHATAASAQAISQTALVAALAPEPPMARPEAKQEAEPLPHLHSMATEASPQLEEAAKLQPAPTSQQAVGSQEPSTAQASLKEVPHDGVVGPNDGDPQMPEHDDKAMHEAQDAHVLGDAVDAQHEAPHEAELEEVPSAGEVPEEQAAGQSSVAEAAVSEPAADVVQDGGQGDEQAGPLPDMHLTGARGEAHSHEALQAPDTPPTGSAGGSVTKKVMASQASAAQKLGLQAGRSQTLHLTVAEKLAEVMQPDTKGLAAPVAPQSRPDGGLHTPQPSPRDAITDQKGIETDIPSFRELRARAVQLEASTLGVAHTPRSFKGTPKGTPKGPIDSDKRKVTVPNVRTVRSAATWAPRQHAHRTVPTPPPPPPPPPRASSKPQAVVDTAASALAVRAADEMRSQQAALGRGLLYKPDVQTVTDKVKELERQMTLVQQSKTQGLRVDTLGDAQRRATPRTAEDGGLPAQKAAAEGGLDLAGPPTPERELGRVASPSSPD